MIIFLYGEDTYRLNQKLNEIITKYKKTFKKRFDLKFYKGKNLNFKDFVDEIQQSSIFTKRKLLVVKDISSNSQFKKEFLKNPKIFTAFEDVILFFEPKEVPETDKFFEFLKKNSKSQKFKLLEGLELKKWTQKEFEKYKSRIDPLALKKLIDEVGNDLWQLSNEIKKLATFKKGKTVTVKDVELLITPKIKTDIFKTIDAICAGNKREALKLLHKHLEKGENPLYILSMIHFQFRNLLIIKDLIERGVPFYLLPKKTGFHPYIIKKSYFLTQKFTIDKLKKIYQKILKIDLKIKKGKITPVLALDSLIVEI